uniref:G_PROTEIN_RECEP_F1_2 domain-containing protein n=1 Tax=Elaeophora elaphi TaxID=1147741 RepID=A0A0R3RLN3_9BILA
MLSLPDNPCMQVIENSLFKKPSLFWNNHRYFNKTKVSNERLGNRPTAVSNSSNNYKADNYEDMTNFHRIFSSRSCITIDWGDPNCLLGLKDSENESPCQIVFGTAFPICVIIIDSMYLAYTIISVSSRPTAISKKADLIRCCIHILLWSIASVSMIYLLYIWHYALKYMNFNAGISKQFFMATLLSPAMTVSFV